MRTGADDRHRLWHEHICAGVRGGCVLWRVSAPKIARYRGLLTTPSTAASCRLQFARKSLLPLTEARLPLLIPMSTSARSRASSSPLKPVHPADPWQAPEPRGHHRLLHHAQGQRHAGVAVHRSATCRSNRGRCMGKGAHVYRFHLAFSPRAPCMLSFSIVCKPQCQRSNQTPNTILQHQSQHRGLCKARP